MKIINDMIETKSIMRQSNCLEGNWSEENRISERGFPAVRNPSARTLAVWITLVMYLLLMNSGAACAMLCCPMRAGVDAHAASCGSSHSVVGMATHAAHSLSEADNASITDRCCNCSLGSSGYYPHVANVQGGSIQVQSFSLASSFVLTGDATETPSRAFLPVKRFEYRTDLHKLRTVFLLI